MLKRSTEREKEKENHGAGGTSKMSMRLQEGISVSQIQTMSQQGRSG